MNGKFFQQFFLLTSEIHRSFNDHTAKQIADTTSPYLSDVDTFTSQSELFACLGFRRNLEIYTTIKSWYFKLSAQSRINKTNRDITV